MLSLGVRKRVFWHLWLTAEFLLCIVAVWEDVLSILTDRVPLRTRVVLFQCLSSKRTRLLRACVQYRPFPGNCEWREGITSQQIWDLSYPQPVLEFGLSRSLHLYSKEYEVYLTSATFHSQSFLFGYLLLERYSIVFYFKSRNHPSKKTKNKTLKMQF